MSVCAPGSGLGRTPGQTRALAAHRGEPDRIVSRERQISGEGGFRAEFVAAFPSYCSLWGDLLLPGRTGVRTELSRARPLKQC